MTLDYGKCTSLVACIMIVVVCFGFVLEAFQLTTLPYAFENMFRVGVEKAPRERKFSVAYAFMLPGATISCYVACCGLVARKAVGRTLMVCYMTWSLMLAGFVTMMVVFTIMMLEEPVRELESQALPAIADWFHVCDPYYCCWAGGRRKHSICEPKSAVPKHKYEEEFLDCLLSADPDYKPKYKYVWDHGDIHECKWSLLYLTHCNGRWNNKFKKYVDDWCVDQMKLVNKSLPRDSRFPPLPHITENLEEIFQTNWTKLEDAESLEAKDFKESVHDSLRDINWKQFAKALSKVDYDSFKWKKFDVHQIFHSNLKTCKLKKDAVKRAYRNNERVLPVMRDIEIDLSLDLFWVSCYVIVSCCGFCCAFAACQHWTTTDYEPLFGHGTRYYS